MNRNKCVIIVPIYKTEFNWDEYNSVKQLFKILPIEKYDIVAICPESLDVQYYNSNFKFKEYFYFWDSYFTEYPRGYNKLLLQQGFYECFSNYEYMLVYQPDSWVFRDELEYWCNREYDFIGAPQTYQYPDLLVNNVHVGNGGFSLRKISFFKYICSEYEDMCRAIYDMNYKLIGEDHICSFLKTSGIAFQINLPPFYEAAFFSFDMNPQILYQVTDNKLPFGCHAYKTIEDKYFWDNFIIYDKKLYSVVTFLFGDYDKLRDPIVVDECAEYICITDRTDLKSDIWEFKNIEGYDISKYNDWQKTLIARYTALNYITTDRCIILDASVQIKSSLHGFINECVDLELGIIVHPFRDSYLDEFDEWINTRNLDIKQKDDFINYCKNNNFDINLKGFIMITLMYVRNNEKMKSIMNHILMELMNNFDFSIRIDQLYFTVILFNYYRNVVMRHYSYQILISKYFTYYYHNSDITHENDYKPNLCKNEIRQLYNQKVICKYLL